MCNPFLKRRADKSELSSPMTEIIKMSTSSQHQRESTKYLHRNRNAPRDKWQK